MLLHFFVLTSGEQFFLAIIKFGARKWC